MIRKFESTSQLLCIIWGTGLDNRERFARLMNFQKVDSVPYIPNFFAGAFNTMPEGSVTANRWHVEGLPIWSSAADYFGTSFDVESVPVYLGMIPPFTAKTLYENEQYVIVQDGSGVKKKIFRRRSSLGALQNWGMPQFLEFPVKYRSDWERLRKRYDPEDPRRLGVTLGDELIDRFEETTSPVCVGITGLFGWCRSLMGLENFLVSLYKDPGLIHDMMEFVAQFTVEVLEPVVETCRIDFGVLGEDMAYKNGPHMSPKHIKEFMVPNYKIQTDFLKKHGIDIVFLDSDGDVRLIIPLWLEAGINGTFPLEVMAGNDAVELRKEYPRELRMVGNIDKFALINGKEAVDKELKYKLPFLLKEGGFIPAVDHGIPPEVPFEHYKYYMQQLKEYLEGYSQE